jgi:hypothetical protein
MAPGRCKSPNGAWAHGYSRLAATRVGVRRPLPRQRLAAPPSTRGALRRRPPPLISGVMKPRSFIAALLLVGVLGAAGAHAGSVREQQAQAAWRKQDECARAAFVKFPDYVPESNAKRAEATRQCERDNNLPERVPANESPIKTIPDDEAN